MILVAGGGNHRHKVDVSLRAVAVSLLVVILLLQPACKWFAAFDEDDKDDETARILRTTFKEVPGGLTGWFLQVDSDADGYASRVCCLL